jgi:hypothetical protein
MREAIAYVRVSSEEQADSGLGLEAQRQRVAAYCEMKDLKLTEVFEDPGISGGKPLAVLPAASSSLLPKVASQSWLLPSSIGSSAPSQTLPT